MIFFIVYIVLKNIQNNENTSEMTFKSLKFLLFSFLGVSSFTFAERYEIDNYIVDVKSLCTEGNVDCQNVDIKLLYLNNCYYFEGKGVTVNSKKSLNFYGYAFYSDDFLYNLYTRGHVALEVLREGEVFYFGYGNIVSDIHEDLESIYMRCVSRE